MGKINYNFTYLCSLKYSKTVQILNLSNNNLSDTIANQLYDLLKENKDLLELYLTWNRFSSVTGVKIFEALIINWLINIQLY